MLKYSEQMKKILIGLLACGFGASVSAQRLNRSLDRGWNYIPGWETRLTAAGQDVDLPHTWNTDALGGKPDYYQGLGGYFKAFEIPAEWEGQRIFIRFGGANSTCDLYVNGKHAGQHRGGYTAFAWEITQWIRFGERNTLSVRVNNAPDLNLPPLVGDFNFYGGLYREVELIVTADTHIALDDYGSSGVYITPVQVSAERAEVNVRACVRGRRGATAEATFILRDGEGNRLDSTVRRVLLDGNGRNEAKASFSVGRPHLWGPKDPYLYDMEVRVKGAEGYDSVRQRFGVRRFEIDAQNRFLLNGEPLTVQGVCRVEDWDGIGNALRPLNHRRDVELLKEMGANAVRCAYFPNDPYFLDLCDREGILVWSDLPLVGAGPYRDKGYNDSEEFRASIRQQLREMIRQQYNHPCVVWWGIFDQLNQRGDDPIALVNELNGIAKQEGGGRLTVAASNQNGQLNFVTDLIGFNTFYGWTRDQLSGFAEWRASLEEYPELRCGVSEYGAGASIYQWAGDSLCRPVAEGPWHPEQWQTLLHETYWEEIAASGSFWGTFVWTMFDYGAAHRTDGARPGTADFGLVTFDRRVCKDAFYFYKANWNRTVPFVYLTGKRFELRYDDRQTLRVFSNQADVELFVNGVSLGLRTNDGWGRFVWEDVALKRGENVIEAVDPLSGSRDRTVIRIEPGGDL